MIGAFGQSSILTCVAADWSPKIGDPNLTGWLTVGSYLVCAVLAAAVWWRRPQMAGRGLWGFITALMLFLAINKQLDLQTALTATGRCMSHAQGWHDQRRIVQVMFILLLMGLMFVSFDRLKRGLGPDRHPHRLALIGLALVACFVLVRAVGFHFVDVLIGLQFFGISANFLLENAGLVLIAVNAIQLLRHPPEQAPVGTAQQPAMPQTRPQAAPTAIPPRQTRQGTSRKDRTLPPRRG